MSGIPVHIQRRFEQRWAARFSNPGCTKECRIERLTVNIAPPRAAKAKERPAGVNRRAYAKRF